MSNQRQAWRRFRGLPWIGLAVCALLGVVMFTLVDLEPQVEARFLFESDDQEFQETKRIEELFIGGQPIFVAVRPSRLVSRETLLRIRDLSEQLEAVEGVASVTSLTHGPEDPAEIPEREPAEVLEDVRDSPFWTDLLLSAEDDDATFVVLGLKTGTDHRGTVRQIDEILADFRSDDFELAASGVTYVAEHMRRSLNRDLMLFSVAAVVVFTLLVALLFPSLPIVVGTIASALSATFATFLVRAALGMKTNILTPNLWTIAFVLTLSHIVYLIANHRHATGGIGGGEGHGDAGGNRPADGAYGGGSIREAVRLTGPASLWSLLANLLGFLSLVFVSAKPLREFGISGSIAALCAIAFAYGMFPVFLAAAGRPRKPGAITRGLERFFTRRHPALAAGLMLVALLLAPFAWQIDTDPALVSYFEEGSAIRDGIVHIDRTIGSSAFQMVVGVPGGGSLGDDATLDRLEALHRDLEEDPAVGSVLSVAHLMTEIDRQWYSFLIPWGMGLDRLEDPENNRVGRVFLSEDRTLGRFIVRMRELRGEGEHEPRDVVVDRLEAAVGDHGLEVVHSGGMYELQGKMSRLVQSSVQRGLGGLVVAFLAITLVTSRSLRAALAMGFCLVLIPLTLFGIVGLVGMPLDIIAAPAANVALPLGIDEMIHLSHWLRRERRGDDRPGWQEWRGALSRMWYPILASVLIVASGFALFLLSRFPPTHRLGILVCVGALLTDAVVLIVLPWLATIGRGRSGTLARARDAGSSLGRRSAPAPDPDSVSAPDPDSAPAPGSGRAAAR